MEDQEGILTNGSATNGSDDKLIHRNPYMSYRNTGILRGSTFTHFNSTKNKHYGNRENLERLNEDSKEEKLKEADDADSSTWFPAHDEIFSDNDFDGKCDDLSERFSDKSSAKSRYSATSDETNDRERCQERNIMNTREEEARASKRVVTFSLSNSHTTISFDEQGNKNSEKKDDLSDDEGSFHTIQSEEWPTSDADYGSNSETSTKKARPFVWRLLIGVVSILIIIALVVTFVLYERRGFLWGSTDSASNKANDRVPSSPSLMPTLLPSENSSNTNSSTAQGDSPNLIPTSSPPTNGYSTEPGESRKPTEMPSMMQILPKSSSLKPSHNPTFAQSLTPTLSQTLTPTRNPVLLIPSMTPSHTGKPSSAPITYIAYISSVVKEISGEIGGGTYHEEAFEWLKVDLLSKQLDWASRTTIAQRYGLALMFLQMGGSNWSRGAYWLTDRDECLWPGTSCNENNEITRIKLDNNKMTGILPKDTFTAITTLNEVDLAYNKISGSIPSSIFDSPIKIMKLHGNIDLGGNIFNADFFKLSDTLEMIDLENDDFEGEIPSKIKDFMNLRVLRLGRNRISGTIPSEIGDLTNLEHLRLNENELKAPIPSEFGNLESLKEFTLSGNDGFGGIIPTFITRLQNLADLEMSRMGLSGRIPDDFFDLTNLRKVFIMGNDLTGPIPNNIEKAKDLYYLSANSNSLTGGLPSFAQNVDLTYLYLHKNNFSGSIHKSLFELPMIKEVKLYNNILTGKIPQVRGDGLQKISVLELHDNKLEGPVPSDICNLKIENVYFRSLKVDCDSKDGKKPQNPCNCCTACAIGKGLP